MPVHENLGKSILSTSASNFLHLHLLVIGWHNIQIQTRRGMNSLSRIKLKYKHNSRRKLFEKYDNDFQIFNISNFELSKAKSVRSVKVATVNLSAKITSFRELAYKLNAICLCTFMFL